jgi:ATP-dependent RNA helicase RhlE
MTFKSLGLSKPILKSLLKKGYETPTPIQKKSIPEILLGNDVIASAETGTGKTASFTLPILNNLSHPKNSHKGHYVKALIITPTRELAAQIRDNILTYGSNLNLRSAAIYGGARIHNQRLKLKKGVDILVATPGRLLDLYNQKSLNLNKVEILVLDEADQMLDMGFIHDIKKIINLLPKKRQNLMFTATFTKSFKQLAKELVINPIEIAVAKDNQTAKNINHYIHPVDKARKAELLIELIEVGNWNQALVFTRTKHGADRLTKQLQKVDITAAAIHGNKTQNNRMKALDSFKKNKIRILVATDVASRGIDIKNMQQVINFDVPTVAKDYIHRIGRTGRAGELGNAISLVSADEYKLLEDIEKLLKKTLIRHEVDGFEPNHNLPITNHDSAKKKINNQRGFKKRRMRKKDH